MRAVDLVFCAPVVEYEIALITAQSYTNTQRIPPNSSYIDASIRCFPIHRRSDMPTHVSRHDIAVGHLLECPLNALVSLMVVGRLKEGGRGSDDQRSTRNSARAGRLEL